MRNLFRFIVYSFRVTGKLIKALFIGIERSAETLERAAILANERNKEWADGEMKRLEERQKDFERAESQNKIRETAQKQKVSLSPVFYNTTEWRDLRYKTLKRYGAMCMCCGVKAGDGVAMHVDHIKPRSKYPELSLDEDNLQILCEKCNLGKSATDETDYRQFYVGF